MSNQHEEALDLLARAARERAPAPDPEVLSGMADEAILAAEGRQRMRRRRAMLAGGVAVAAAVVLAVVSGTGGFGGAETVDESPARFSTLSLPGGHSVRTTGDAEIRLSPDEDGLVVQRSGEALYEVAPLAPGARFVVGTPHGEVSVLGTVFTVGLRDGDTVVRVFEGRVEARFGDRRVSLEAGETASSSGEGDVEPGVLDEVAREAARRRVNSGRVEERHEVPAPRGAVSASDPEEAGAEPSVRAASPVMPSPRHRSPASEPLETNDSAGGGEEPEPSVPTLRRAREALLGGLLDEALRLSRAVRAEGTRVGDAWVLEGDALRALGRLEEAARAYDRAVPHQRPGKATEAGYAAARSWFELGRRDRARRALDASRADADGSPLEERALVLRIRIARSAGDEALARTLARRHRIHFPDSTTPWIERLAEGESNPEELP